MQATLFEKRRILFFCVCEDVAEPISVSTPQMI